MMDKVIGYPLAALALLFLLLAMGVAYTGAALMALVVGAEDKAKARWGGQ